MQFSAKVPTALDEQGLVDRFVGDLHLPLTRKDSPEIVADLLGRPVLPESFLHGRDQLGVDESADLWPTSSEITAFLCSVGAVDPRASSAVSAQFSGYCRGRPVKFPGDLADASAG